MVIEVPRADRGKNRFTSETILIWAPTAGTGKGLPVYQDEVDSMLQDAAGGSDIQVFGDMGMEVLDGDTVERYRQEYFVTCHPEESQHSCLFRVPGKLGGHGDGRQRYQPCDSRRASDVWKGAGNHKEILPLPSGIYGGRRRGFQWYFSDSGDWAAACLIFYLRVSARIIIGRPILSEGQAQEGKRTGSGRPAEGDLWRLLPTR